MINTEQLRNLIMQTLSDFDKVNNNSHYYSLDAVELLLLTAAQESNLGYYIEQVKGPALGIFQMEPFTFMDIKNHLPRKVINSIKKVANIKVVEFSILQYNLKAAILFARLHFSRFNEPLPDKRNIQGMAQYYKKYYNTYKGKATTGQALEKYLKYVI